MRVDELRAGIAAVREQGRLPFFVNATGGTTVLGAIDPLTEIAAVCRAENLWLHVDVRASIIQRRLSRELILRCNNSIARCRLAWAERCCSRKNTGID